jgi:Rieske 2Fe-2S family protein
MPALPISPAEIDAVLAPIDRAVSLPPVAFCDPAVFLHERASVLHRTWLPVGREDDVARPGEWILAPLISEGILVVRGSDLELRAFYNVCRHRATKLLVGPSGRVQEIRCPYHGWVYELTGALRDVTHAPSGFDRAEHGLSRVRVDVWQGFVFVTLDESLPALQTFLGAIPPWLIETPLREAKRAHRAEYEVSANWKLLVENFQESFDFSRVHPPLQALTPNERAESHLTEGPWLGGTMTFAEGRETVSESGTRQGRPFLAHPTYRRQVSDAMLFPTFLTSLQPDYLLTYRLQPLEVDRTRVVAETFVHPAALHPSFDLREVVDFWAVVNAEDRAICERQQEGVRSRGARPSRYATVEEGVHAFDRWIARAYAP